MAGAKVLLVESYRPSIPSYAEALESKGYKVIIEHNTRRALKRVASFAPDIVVLDMASLKTSGARICRALNALLDDTPILIIGDRRNRPDAGCGAALTLMKPFTARKLVNGVAKLVPLDERGVLQVGPIKLNLQQTRISCGDREERVTPRLAKLLEYFLRHPGELLTRERLIKGVWETDYTGDTRTLDVHMSWLRGVLEPNPSRPRYLKTVRGHGYRLEVPEPRG